VPEMSVADDRVRGGDASDSDDSIGPTLPGQESRSSGRMGPSIPSMQDLELKRGISSSCRTMLMLANISFRA